MTTPVTDDARCPFKTVKGRRCLLEAGHAPVSDKDPGHKMMNRTGAKPVLPKGLALTAEVVKSGEAIKKVSNRTPEPRDDDQKARDADAKKNYTENHRRGNTSETPFASLAINRYVVPKTAYDAVLYMLRRAVQSGGPLPYDGSVRLRYRQQATTKGHIELQWAFTDYVKPAEPAKPAAS